MRLQPRALAGELRWLVDPTDPLRPYNASLARVFATRWPKAVVGEARLMPTEGHMIKAQARFVRQLVLRYPWVTDVVEIGFNAGHSSYLFLSSRPDVRVVSFDLGDHDYVGPAKELIDRRFPGRHELVLGDSRQTVPAYAGDHPDRRFDLAFIDGGHDYEVARADIANCRALATPRTIVLMDDLQPGRAFGEGPVRAWSEAVASGAVEQTALVEEGFPLTELPLESVDPDRVVWALGRYPGA
ncbi:MAG: class I SAM-dependent methyltransferase [Acidimicrobiales bacterium]